MAEAVNSFQFDPEVTAELDQLPPLEAMRILKGNLALLVAEMRVASAPPTGTERHPLTVKPHDAAKLLDTSTSSIRRAADELGIGQHEKGAFRRFSTGDLARIRHHKRLDPLPPEGSSPFTLVVFNQKGGVGKTTTANNLAQDLASRGYRILIVDMDPQSSLTASWLVANQKGKLVGEGDLGLSVNDTAAPILIAETSSFDGLIRRTHWENVDIVPSHPDLIEGGIQMIEQLMQNNTGFWPSFRDACRALSSDRYDLIIVDTAPSLWLDAVEVALAADGLVIPVPPRNLDIESAKSFIHTLEKWLSQLDGKYTVALKWFRFLMTQRQAGSDSEDKNEKRLRKFLGPMLLKARVPKMEVLARSSGAKPSVFEAVGPDAPKSAARSAQDARSGLRLVHDQIFELVSKTWKEV